MVSTTDTDRTEKLGITLPISLLHKIDKNRGETIFFTYVDVIEYFFRDKCLSQ
jgi:hypothetical protein